MKQSLFNLSRNFYVITGICFLIWMAIFDTNDFVSQYQMSQKLHDLEEKKAYYSEKIEEVKKDRKELLSNPKLLEKFAREKYLMKKSTEDVFVLVTKDNEPIE